MIRSGLFKIAPLASRFPSAASKMALSAFAVPSRLFTASSSRYQREPATEEDHGFVSEYASAIEDAKAEVRMNRAHINTRGKYREQVCRTPFLKTSQKRLNMTAQFISGLDVEEAILQLMFLKRNHTEEIVWALQEGCRIMKEIQGFEDVRNLYVAWAYVCRGRYTKKIDIRGRGRCGRIRSPEAHMVMMLRDKVSKLEPRKSIIIKLSKLRQQFFRVENIIVELPLTLSMFAGLLRNKISSNFEESTKHLEEFQI